jgi:glycosyltransferase involved in cell wall biosynthesis
LFLLYAIWLKDIKVNKDKNHLHRKKIIIASVLKPISDPRMFEKFGLSLDKTDKYLVFLVGYSGKYINVYPNLRFKQLYDFGRLSFSRILAPFRFFIYIFKVNPRIIIIQTHELLWAACLYKLIFQTKIIYDVQENYYRNFIHSNAYDFLIKMPLALYVRMKEKITSSFINHFILAEKCYSTELTFIPKGQSTVIENKYFHFQSETEDKLKPIIKRESEHSDKEKKRFVFTGTIAKSTGVFDAIKLVKKLYEINKDVYLVIAGQCANQKDLNTLKAIAKKSNYIKLKCKSTPMHHEDILKEIRESQFGIISYPINKITAEKFPTKLYEYLANSLPVICTKNQLWEDLINVHHGGIAVDFKNINASEVLKEINEKRFYDNHYPKDELLWKNDEAKLINVINNI